MDVVLIPGFWLDASSWDGVLPPLRAAGHRVHPLTLPGLEAPEADRRGIRLSDHVAAVIDVVDRLAGPVVLVGHSGGSPIAHAVVDARPERIALAVHVDSWPLPEGAAINDELAVVDGEVPLPDWSVFSEGDLRDLDDTLRASFRARAVPQPAGVARDPQVLTDPRRHEVPATVIACEVPGAEFQTYVASGHPLFSELGALHDVDYVDLPTGHWPQLTKPRELAEAILAAITRVG